MPAIDVARRPRIVVLVVAAVVLGCCGGYDDGDGPGLTTPASAVTTSMADASTTTTAGVTTTARVTTTSGPGASNGLTAADVDEISRVFEAFFGGSTTSVDQKLTVLQDGERYRGMIEGAAANEQFQGMSTDIREVRAGTSTECESYGAGEGCAVVVHDLLVGGFPMAAAISSPAVRSGSTWLVGSAAWCNVVAIGGASCADEVAPESTEAPA